MIGFEGDFSVPWFSTIKPGEQARLSRLMRVNYTDGSYKDVQITHHIKEGNGTISNEDYYTMIYTAPAFEDDWVKLEVSYTECGITTRFTYNFMVTNDQNKNFSDRIKATINSKNAQISLYDGTTLKFSSNNVTDSAEIIFSKYVEGIAMSNNATSLFDIRTSGNYSGTVEIMIPLNNPNLNIDCIYLGAIDNISGENIKLPIRKETHLLSPSSNNVNRFNIFNSFIVCAVLITAESGVIATSRTLRYLTYNPEPPINNSKILDVPFYRQYYNECTLVSLLMCLKATNIRTSVYKMAHEIGVNIKDIGTRLIPFLGHVEKIKSYLQQYSRSLIDISSLTRCKNEFINRYIIKPIDSGIPVIMSYPKSYSTSVNFNNVDLGDIGTWKNLISITENTGHSFVVVGYDGAETITSNGDYSGMNFYVHDPSEGAFLKYKYSDFIKEYYSELRTLAWTISSFTPQNYITIHMPDGNKSENKGIGYKLNENDTQMTDVVTWNYIQGDGYIFNNAPNMSLPSNFYELNFNSIPIFNIFDQPKTLSIVSAIYNQNDNLVANSTPKEISLDSIRRQKYNNIFHEFTSNNISAVEFNNELISKNIFGNKFQLYLILLYPSQIIINPFQIINTNYSLDYFKVDFIYEKLLLTANDKFCQEITIGRESTLKLNSYINSKANPEKFTNWTYSPNTIGNFSIFENELTYVSPRNFDSNFSFEVFAKYKSPNYPEELNTSIKINVEW